MKLKDDTPISSKKEDLLNHTKFSENLANALINVESKRGFCVGLFGEWGAGKTSVINLFLEELNNLPNQHPLPIIFKFEPWLISGQDSLIKYFLSELKKVLRNYTNSKSALKTSDLIHEYERVFNFSKKELEKNGIYEFDEDITFIRDRITKELKLLQNIIVIIIDDIDRLPDDEIIQIFKLIKSVADFPNIRYLISFDRHIVVNALNKIQHNKGNEYLEKIIQVNFELPFLSHTELQKFLLGEIDITLSSISKYKFDKDYWYLAYHNGFKHFFSSLRDVKRFINTLSFNIAILSDSINMVDFLVVIALQVFEKEIYYEIRSNKELFILNEDEYNQRLMESDSDYFKEHKIIFEKIISKASCTSENVIKSLLETIFPKVKKTFDEKGFGLYYENHWRKNGRICSSEHFDTFFNLSVYSDKISLLEIENTLNLSHSENQFREAIQKILEQNKILQFLDRLEDYTSDNILIKDIECIVTVFMDMGDLFPEEEQNLFSFGTSMKLMRIFYQLLRRVKDQSERLRILKNAMEKAENSIFPLVQKISIEEQSNEKDPLNSRDTSHILNSEQLNELKLIAIKKIEEWINNQKLFMHPEISYILFRLSNWNQESLINKIIIAIKDNNLRLINFILSMSGFVSSSDKGNYLRIKLENVSKFINIEEVEKKLRAFFNSNEFVNLNERQKEAVSVFLDTYDGKIKHDFY